MQLDHGRIRRRPPFALVPLLLFGCGFGLAGATLVDWGCCFHMDGYFTRGQPWVFADVDSKVGVERLQLFGKELVGQRVEAVRAPVQPGPFQKVEPRRDENIAKGLCAALCFRLILNGLIITGNVSV